jgi:hypothetical protein
MCTGKQGEAGPLALVDLKPVELDEPLAKTVKP